MRKIFHISALVLLYLLCTAKSCDNQEQADEVRDRNQIKLTRDSIMSTFGSDTLPVASLRAFEGMAVIKLSDFSDYLTILRDTSKAKPFRDKAREMIRGLFISENSIVRISDPDTSGTREVTIKQLLRDGDKGSEPFGKIIIDSIRTKQDLKRNGDSIYVGKLSYSYFYNRHNPAIASNPSPVNGTIEFFLVHHQKIFGKETMMVWDVFLGNIE